MAISISRQCQTIFLPPSLVVATFGQTGKAFIFMLILKYDISAVGFCPTVGKLSQYFCFCFYLLLPWSFGALLKVFASYDEWLRVGGIRAWASSNFFFLFLLHSDCNRSHKVSIQCTGTDNHRSNYAAKSINQKSLSFSATFPTLTCFGVKTLPCRLP